MSTSTTNLEWAKNYVAGLNEQELSMLKQLYDKHRADEEVKERERAQQQEILDLLTSQKPVTIDVVRSSISPESFTSCSASSSEVADGEITVKDVLLGKIKSAFRPSSPRADVKPYRPRGSRERVLFDGHLFTFDKLSYDCKKRFFRCERKNTCSARVHTPIDCDRVIHKAQTHNHLPPTPFELANYEIDMDKVRSGFVLPVNPIHNRAHALVPILTPKLEFEEENLIPKPVQPVVPLIQRVKDEMMETDTVEKKPVVIRLPDNFNISTGLEKQMMELTITKFLLQQTELRHELFSKKGDLPKILAPASHGQLTLFVASLTDDVFHMIPVKERNELSIREAIQGHFKQESNRCLMINVAAKINIPLQQQMIDDWKSEEFLRVDVSKPNAWKIFRLTKAE